MTDQEEENAYELLDQMIQASKDLLLLLPKACPTEELRRECLAEVSENIKLIESISDVLKLRRSPMWMAEPRVLQ